MRATRPASLLRAPALGAALAWCVLALASCAGMDPAVVLDQKPAGHLVLPLDGAFDVTARAPFSGSLTARFNARPTPLGFVASTRPGVAWSSMSGLARLLGPLVAPTLFPDGVILTWSSALPMPGAPGEGWIGVAGMKSLGLRTRMVSVEEPIELISREGRRVGVIEVSPCGGAGSDAVPSTDYRVLAASIGEAFRAHVYDPDLARSGATRAYLRQLEAAGERARDDAEFVFGAVLAARNNLRINTPIMWREDGASESSVFARWDEHERSTIHVEFDERTRIATVKVEAFMDAGEVDRAMQRVIERAPAGLVVDLRTCPGVTLASLRLAAWVVEAPVEVGTFVGGRARRDTGRSADDAPTFHLASANDCSALQSVLERAGAVGVVVMPAAPVFSGPVAVLTGRRTSASAEALVNVLRASGRARTFGQATAGRPVVSRSLDVGQGWVLWVAAWDYRPPGGGIVGTAGRTIVPDVVCRDPKQNAIDWLRSMR